MTRTLRTPHTSPINWSDALGYAVEAARSAGKLMRDNLRLPKKINEATQHDIKLELDVRCQKRIEKILLGEFPQLALLGEEGSAGEIVSEHRWVVDPIDGTVNYAHGIPHACVSIAWQTRHSGRGGKKTKLPSSHREHAYETQFGVIYDPFCDELWTAIRSGAARLNGKLIQVSQRRRLDECVVTLGFSKDPGTLEQMLAGFNFLLHRVRKLRIMGAGALDLAYVACGRFDAYLEPRVRLWDIAAGGLLIECAGGEFWREPLPLAHAYRIIASNGKLRKQLPKFA
ncbi:MAG: inositol monophosphatase [Verrucomicrobia bacterium]|nr:inositol monophosphatase [Verrucomicrobiota bacterium]